MKYLQLLAAVLKVCFVQCLLQPNAQQTVYDKQTQLLTTKMEAYQVLINSYWYLNKILN